MSIKISILKAFYKKCPECGGELYVWENYKVLLGKTFKILRCKNKSCDWMKC